MFYLFLTVILWGSTAVLTYFLGPINSLFLMGTSLLLGGIIGVPKLKLSQVNIKPLIATSVTYFFYNYFLFESFRAAPIVEANIIQDTWPTIIILLGPLYIKSEKFNLKYFSILAVSAVATYMFSEKVVASMSLEHIRGYMFAIAAGLMWANYSLYAKLHEDGITESTIAASYLLSSAAAIAMYIFEEGAVIPDLTPAQVGILALIGIGPFGVSGYTWAIGVTKASSSTVGLISQLTPVVSNILLFVFAGEVLDKDLILPVLLILLFPPLLENFLATKKT